jgi:hypothetical protein
MCLVALATCVPCGSPLCSSGFDGSRARVVLQIRDKALPDGLWRLRLRSPWARRAKMHTQTLTGHRKACEVKLDGPVTLAFAI